MNRRDFLQFVGISSGAAIASKALVNIPEAEKQIILLDKPT
ncbi:MAG: twin-arginine translocation signal domain-containing protein, partial [bacterium]|nr:twin-arginine translocation signal domain-containing protein [bacterium]